MNVLKEIPYSIKEQKINNLRRNAENKGVKNGIGFFKQQQKNAYKIRMSKVKMTRKELREIFS